MRRADREVKDLEKAVEIMDRCTCCRIGMTDGDMPYVVPLNFGYSICEGKITLYFHSAKNGKKIDLIRKNKTACFEMDFGTVMKAERACDFSFDYKSMMGYGKIFLIDDRNEKIKGLDLIMKHYKSDKRDYDEKVLDNVYVIKIEVENWSAKSRL